MNRKEVVKIISVWIFFPNHKGLQLYFYKVSSYIYMPSSIAKLFLLSILIFILNSPEGKEDDCLNRQELPHWIKGLEEFPGAFVEVDQTVQGNDLGHRIH